MESYRAITKARKRGTAEATDADAVITQTAKAFGIADLKKLIAVQRR